jgi:hypothetical protein
MGADSNWGDIDPEAVSKIKMHITQAVADGIDDALARGAMRDAIASGVATGMQSVVEDEDLFTLVVDRLAGTVRSAAAHSAGDLVIGGASRLVSIAMWGGVILLGAWALGGMAGLKAAWSLLISGGKP